MKNKKFCDITDSYELVKYLKSAQRLSNINYLCKYMKLSSVLECLSTGMWLLNNPQNMNDLYEYRSFNDKEKWNHICFASFITQSTESMAMWSMYAQPWEEGVMVSIPTIAVKKLINDTEFVIAADYNEKTGRYVPSKTEIPSKDILSLSRVAYYDGLYITCTGRDDRNMHFGNPYKIAELTGYIKDSAWDYEKEVRLRVDIPSQYNYNAAFIKLTEDYLNQISITSGPRFAGNVLTSIPSKYKAKISIDNSKFKEKLAWIPCDNCSKKQLINE